MSAKIPGDTHPVIRLLPDRTETNVAEQLADLDLGKLAPPERPYLILNFAITRIIMAFEWWLSPHLRRPPAIEPRLEAAHV